MHFGGRNFSKDTHTEGKFASLPFSAALSYRTFRISRQATFQLWCLAELREFRYVIRALFYYNCSCQYSPSKIEFTPSKIDPLVYTTVNIFSNPQLLREKMRTEMSNRIHLFLSTTIVFFGTLFQNVKTSARDFMLNALQYFESDKSMEVHYNLLLVLKKQVQ